MPVNLASEIDLREALRPRRVDREIFEAGVRAKLEAARVRRADDPLAGQSPLLRSAAAYLPLAILSGCKSTPAAAAVARPVVAYKFLSWLAFPAVSLFVLLGATLFSVAKIRVVREGSDSELDDKQKIEETLKQWWHRHQWAAYGVFAISLTLAMIGATSFLFLMYIVSFAIVVYMLGSLSRLGLGNRQVIGRSCWMLLVFLGQVAGFSGIGFQEIHFVDPPLVGSVFFGGALILMLVLYSLKKFDNSKLAVEMPGVAIGLFACIVIPLLLWQSHPILWAIGPAQIKRFVERFDNAPYQSASWHGWEIPARWAVESNLNPDLTLPRRLLDETISGDQNAYIVGTALRVGLLPTDRLGELRDYPQSREFLLSPPPNGLKPFPISSVEQSDWVIRSAVLRRDLSDVDADLLEKRLLATLDDQLGRKLAKLESILRVTHLLDVIGRPVDRNQYRDRVHDLLREFHVTHAGAFQLSGGFRTFRNRKTNSWWQPGGDLEPTSYAVELMQIYGIPDGIDLNWVRSFLKPMAMRFQDDKWIAAATRERLNQIPGMTQSSWVEVLYYERTLLAALILVGLCFYATFRSSSPKRVEPVLID